MAGGALAGVAVAFLTVKDSWARVVGGLSLEHGLTGQLGPGGYQILGLCAFGAMAATLYKISRGRGWQDSNLLPPAS